MNKQTDRRTHRQTDISTYRKHWPRGPMLWKRNVDRSGLSSPQIPQTKPNQTKHKHSVSKRQEGGDSSASLLPPRERERELAWEPTLPLFSLVGICTGSSSNSSLAPLPAEALTWPSATQSQPVRILGTSFSWTYLSTPSKSIFFLRRQIFWLKIMHRGIGLKCHKNM